VSVPRSIARMPEPEIIGRFMIPPHGLHRLQGMPTPQQSHAIDRAARKPRVSVVGSLLATSSSSRPRRFLTHHKSDDV
jgi:hypothetical protein